MAVKEVLLAGNPKLREKSGRVNDLKGLKPLVGNLRDTLEACRKKYGVGRGIAAPQIGVLQRVIYVNTEEYAGEMINPEVISRRKKTLLCWDSCLSYNAAVFAKVLRWSEIEVSFQVLSGEQKTLEASGSLSELLQHEIDHLDGVLFMDRRVEDGEWMIMREEWEKMGRPFKA